MELFFGGNASGSSPERGDGLLRVVATLSVACWLLRRVIGIYIGPNVVLHNECSGVGMRECSSMFSQSVACVFSVP